LIQGVGLWLRSSCGALLTLDTQAQFVLADFQQCPELLNLLRVHAINVISCVTVTKVMLVTVCLKRKAATLRLTHCYLGNAAPAAPFALCSDYLL
jgi:hypothetical protein